MHKIAVPIVAAHSVEPGKEEEWIRSAVDGDETAFHELYKQHRDGIYSFLYYMVRDSHVAEDLLQSVFLKIFRGLPQYRFESGFRTWACKIALNESRNYRKRNTKHVSLEVIRGTSVEIDTSPDPHERRQVDVRKTIVRNILMQLKPVWREVVVLKYVDGLSYEEIAMVIGRSPGTVASRLNRALEKMEQLLQRYRHRI